MSCFTQILSEGFCVISVSPRHNQLEAQKLVGRIASPSPALDWPLV